MIYYFPIRRNFPIVFSTLIIAYCIQNIIFLIILTILPSLIIFQDFLIIHIDNSNFSNLNIQGCIQILKHRGNYCRRQMLLLHNIVYVSSFCRHSVHIALSLQLLCILKEVYNHVLTDTDKALILKKCSGDGIKNKECYGCGHPV